MPKKAQTLLMVAGLCIAVFFGVIVSSLSISLGFMPSVWAPGEGFQTIDMPLLPLVFAIGIPAALFGFLLGIDRETPKRKTRKRIMALCGILSILAACITTALSSDPSKFVQLSLFNIAFGALAGWSPGLGFKNMLP